MMLLFARDLVYDILVVACLMDGAYLVFLQDDFLICSYYRFAAG